MLGHYASTNGENLYKYIRENVFSTDDAFQFEKLSSMQVGGRSSEHADYFFGYACASIFSRLIKKTEKTLDELRPSPERIISRYIEETLEIVTFTRSATSTRMAALAIRAVESSHKEIPSSVRKAVNGERMRQSCYICGNFLQKDSDDPTIRLEYEHIWPSSYGGDSIAENILPACKRCNNAKGDMILWHTAHIGALCLKPNPSPDELTKVSRPLLIAAHMKKIFTHASFNRISLKNSALQIGPISPDRHKSPYPDDARDFFNFEYL